MGAAGVVVFFAIAVQGTHYGNPFDGPCLKDEDKVAWGSLLPGEVCAPRYDGKCPTDTPAGCKITPIESLHEASGVELCGLVCARELPIEDQKLADTKCGVASMSCKPFHDASGVAFCTYDGKSPKPTPKPTPKPACPSCYCGATFVAATSCKQACPDAKDASCASAGGKCFASVECTHPPTPAHRGRR